jgi:superfamily II DNA helicase RecQ
MTDVYEKIRVKFPEEKTIDLPQTTDDLTKIKGITKAKIKRFIKLILKVCQDCFSNFHVDVVESLYAQK